jgi:hypothetical protein
MDMENKMKTKQRVEKLLISVGIATLIFAAPSIQACQLGTVNNVTCASGNYAESCWDNSCNGSTLTATCCTSCNGGDSNGKNSNCNPQTTTTSIDASKCPGQKVSNDNGKLVCSN